MVDMLVWRCPGDYTYLQLEGSLPGVGSLSKAAGGLLADFLLLDWRGYRPPLL